MSDIKYPVYRKFTNRKEFMKLNSNGVILKVHIIRENIFSISHAADNCWMKDAFNDPEISEDSTRDEFEKVYGQAQYLLTKANVEQ